MYVSLSRSILKRRCPFFALDTIVRGLRLYPGAARYLRVNNATELELEYPQVLALVGPIGQSTIVA